MAVRSHERSPGREAEPKTTIGRMLWLNGRPYQDAHLIGRCRTGRSKRPNALYVVSGWSPPKTPAVKTPAPINRGTLIFRRPRSLSVGAIAIDGGR